MAISTSAASTSFPVTFKVPSAVAKMGVYAAVFGNAQNNASQFVYLTQTGGTASTTTLSTTTTNAVAPTATSIPVGSVAGFPASGNIFISQPGLSMSVAYTGVDATGNTFTGTTFPAGAPGIGSGATVTLSNVLGTTINVASTAGFPGSGSLMIETPPGYAPSQNVVVNYTATTATAFTGVTGYGSLALPGGGAVIQTPEPASSMNYAVAPYGQNLPLINLFPASGGPYLDTNPPVSATLNLPDPGIDGILSGVMVISVGSPIAIPVLGSAASASVGSPTPLTNPNDKFGLFEWGITGTSLDFDVSEVDQVGFPFQVTTTGANPPPPADPTLGVGLLPDRDTLFSGFTSFIDNLDAASNAAAFIACAAGNSNAPFPVNTRITAPQDIIGVLEGDPPVALGAAPAGTPGSYTSVTAYYAVTATSAAGESMLSNIVTGVTGTANDQLQVSWSPYPYATGYNVYWSLSSGLGNAQLIAGGLTATNYIDTTPGSHTGTPQTPPVNNYLYDPLNQYFEGAIKDFFDYYRPLDPASPTTTFVLDDQATQTRWSGYTTDVYASGDSGPQYTMLQLTGGAGQWGDQFDGKILNVYQPLFSSNTVNSAYPPAPSWLTAIYSAWESASSMVFGADGVFGSVVDAASTLDVGDAKNVYNNIVSALNRGITPRKSGSTWVNVLPPSYWASSPLLTSATAAAGGSLTAGSYRYAITAVNIDAAPLKGVVKSATDTDPIVIASTDHGLQTGDRVIIARVSGNTNANGTFTVSVIDANSFSIPVAGNGDYPGSSHGFWQQVIETTPSNIIQVDVASGQNTVALEWAAINGPGGPVGAETAAGFNIYRSQLGSNGVWSGLQKLNDSPIVNSPATPVTDFTDDGSYTAQGHPPFVYYADGQLANFYAAYFSRLDVSINGLGYGFPYADKNGQSTNVQMPLPGPTGLEIRLLPWTK